MFRNYIDETYIKGYVPELSLYLWAGETTFDKAKQSAEQEVATIFSNMGKDLRLLRPHCVLRELDTVTSTETGDSVEDTISRLRYVVNVTSYTSAQTVIVEGSNDDDTYTTIATVTVSTTGVSSGLITFPYKYYRVSTTGGGTITYEAYLVETSYDLLFAFKWLEIIFQNAVNNGNDEYAEKRDYFRNAFYDTLNKFSFQEDKDDDGEIDEDENSRSNIVDILA